MLVASLWCLQLLCVSPPRVLYVGEVVVWHLLRAEAER